VTDALFVSDLHGNRKKYLKLFDLIRREPPSLVFLGGDLLPHEMLSLNPMDPYHQDFISHFLAAEFGKLKEELGTRYPRVFMIFGNDDPRFEEAALIVNGAGGLWTYLHERRVDFDGYGIYGYACVPPTPFLLKDWERFDVSRFVDVGCVSPLEGTRTMPVSRDEIEYGTIAADLDRLAGEQDLSRGIFLFHSPPYDTPLDLADLEGKMIDHAPLDPHIGSIAIRRFIEDRQPLITLHGHVHESFELSGEWRVKMGKTWAFSAAHRGHELAAVLFSLEEPGEARRICL
jgi:uncharacterized protein